MCKQLSDRSFHRSQWDMHSNHFSHAKSWDVEKKHNTKNGTWFRTMCPHILKKRLKSLVKSFEIKKIHKSLYTTLKGPLEERCGEWTKIEINASQLKVTSILGWKSPMKGGDQLQQMDGKGEGLSWFHQMGLQVCSELEHVLFECTPLHEQRFVRSVVVLIEVG